MVSNESFDEWIGFLFFLFFFLMFVFFRKVCKVMGLLIFFLMLVLMSTYCRKAEVMRFDCFTSQKSEGFYVFRVTLED